jgi:hypothetical protein
VLEQRGWTLARINPSLLLWVPKQGQMGPVWVVSPYFATMGFPKGPVV